jgi:hypothetical protein
MVFVTLSHQIQSVAGDDFDASSGLLIWILQQRYKLERQMSMKQTGDPMLSQVCSGKSQIRA